jgi:hypothetical protein
MSRGDRVVVRAYGDTPLIRRVWEVTEQAVYIHNEENYRKHAKGIATVDPVGLRREDVFIYDPATFPKGCTGMPQDDAFWAQLQRYQ